jgi:aminomethyltransferase
VVSRIENRGQPSQRLVGIVPEARPEAGATVVDGDSDVGEVTRSVDSPLVEAPIAFALLAADAGEDLAVHVDGEDVPATRRDLPFVTGSARSARIPDDV